VKPASLIDVSTMRCFTPAIRAERDGDWPLLRERAKMSQ